MAFYQDSIENIYSVSEITQEIKDTLEYGLPPIWVQGEVSNFVHHGSGHLYFSLKDQDSQISCVMWKSRTAGLSFRPLNGSTVNAYGSIKVYEKRGTYQLDIQKMAPVGIGDLQLAFEELKTKLLNAGLFENEHKKPLPSTPQRIGIITSQTGAAIRDIVAGLNRRAPGVEKILRPTLVQGEGAAQDIAAAIHELNDYGKVDVIILGRGGGSIEDLWAFNEEVVARAIFASDIPIVSAVGHQIDFTISDFVADVRAATPTAAAEIVTPDWEEVARSLRLMYARCVTALQTTLSEKSEALTRLAGGYEFRRPVDRVLQKMQRLDDLIQAIRTRSRYKLTQCGESLQMQQKRMQALHPASIMQRGYAVVQHKRTREVIRHTLQLENDDMVRIYFAKGATDGLISNIDPDGNLSHMSKD